MHDSCFFLLFNILREFGIVIGAQIRYNRRKKLTVYSNHVSKCVTFLFHTVIIITFFFVTLTSLSSLSLFLLHSMAPLTFFIYRTHQSVEISINTGFVACSPVESDIQHSKVFTKICPYLYFSVYQFKIHLLV